MNTVPRPRIAPLRADEWSEEARDLLRGHVDRVDHYLSGEPDAPPMPAILGVLGQHPELASAWLHFNGALLGSTVLRARDRELLILRVAWLARSDYEWEQHSRIGRQAGLTVQEVEAVPLGPEAGLWTAAQRALLLATDEMLQSGLVSDATWDGLSECFDDRQLLEALFVVGAYWGLALVLNNVGLPSSPPLDGGATEVPAAGPDGPQS